MTSISRRGPRRRSAGQNQSAAKVKGGDWWESFLVLVAKCLNEAGPDGLTEQELCSASGEKHGSVSAAFVYLARAKLAFRSRSTRLRGKAQGVPALVWVAKQEWVQNTAVQSTLPFGR
jgi:hypothetical protein